MSSPNLPFQGRGSARPHPFGRSATHADKYRALDKSPPERGRKRKTQLLLSQGLQQSLGSVLIWFFAVLGILFPQVLFPSTSYAKYTTSSRVFEKGPIYAGIFLGRPNIAKVSMPSESERLILNESTKVEAACTTCYLFGKPIYPRRYPS
jgi:hypothetical protein